MQNKDPVHQSPSENDPNTGSSTHLNTTNTNSKSTQQTTTRMERYKSYFRILRPTIEILVFDVALPLTLYYILRIWVSPMVALLVSGIPPLLRVIYTFWRKRKVNVLGCIVVAAFVISAIVSIVSGDARIILLRESAITAIVSVVFLVTLIPLSTRWITILPLVFLLAQQVMAEAPPMRWTDSEGEKKSMPTMDWIWKASSMFRKYCYILTGLWGIILMGEFVAKVIMIKSSLSVDQVVLYGNIIVVVAVVVMTIGTFVATQMMQKRLNATLQKWQNENDFTERFSENSTQQEQIEP